MHDTTRNTIDGENEAAKYGGYNSNSGTCDNCNAGSWHYEHLGEKKIKVCDNCGEDFNQ